jgi:hypothetical protein
VAGHPLPVRGGDREKSRATPAASARPAGRTFHGRSLRRPAARVARVLKRGDPVQLRSFFHRRQPRPQQGGNPMNRRSACVALVLCLPFAFAFTSARADQFGTKPEAKALVEKGAAFIQKSGKASGLAEITMAADKQGSLIDRDLYIFAYDFSGKVVAHGANKKLVGKNLFDMQDTDGKYVIRELIEAAKKGSGWVDYKWSHPETKKIHQKSAYILKIDDDLWIGCGAYSS